MTENIIQSVNWHVTGKCNYNCEFCYVQNLSSETKDLGRIHNILQTLQSTKNDHLDIQKINFVGGEPFLHPYFYEMLKMADDMGFVTSIVTNGSFINEGNMPKIADYTDWIGLSVDSVSDEIEATLGRGRGEHVSHCIDVAELVHEYGLKLKLNTTVTSLTFNEDWHQLVDQMNPHRWKIFQMLHIKGQNDSCINELSITDEQFVSFRQRHQDIRLRGNVTPTFESNDDMIGSYLILGPSGEVISNKGGEYTPFELDHVLKNPAIVIDSKKYIHREGVYAW